MALLGEMHFVPSHIDSAFNLPRQNGVALAVQETWVQNETIRNNILFHSEYDEARYKKGECQTSPCRAFVFSRASHAVLYQCALEQDMAMFEAGDQTEVGERGLTLRFVFGS